jgi:hypothetical protein
MLLAGSAVGLALTSAIAAAQQAPSNVTVEVKDPFFEVRSRGGTVNLTATQDADAPFSWNGLPEAQAPSDPSGVEVQLSAGGGDAPLDVAIAQRASVNTDPESEAERRASGSELRIGRGLVDRREASGEGSMYAFVASDDEALTWQPGARNAFGGPAGSLALQNQVQVGDLSAGVTYERNGIQASLAYVEREESARVGQQNYSQDQSFTGVTVTMRR